MVLIEPVFPLVSIDWAGATLAERRLGGLEPIGAFFDRDINRVGLAHGNNHVNQGIEREAANFSIDQFANASALNAQDFGNLAGVLSGCTSKTGSWVISLSLIHRSSFISSLERKMRFRASAGSSKRCSNADFVIFRVLRYLRGPAAPYLLHQGSYEDPALMCL